MTKNKLQIIRFYFGKKNKCRLVPRSFLLQKINKIEFDENNKLLKKQTFSMRTMWPINLKLIKAGAGVGTGYWYIDLILIRVNCFCCKLYSLVF